MYPQHTSMVIFIILIGVDLNVKFTHYLVAVAATRGSNPGKF